MFKLNVKMSETKLTDPSEQNSKEKSKSEEFSRIVIADYLENYDKTTRNGSCKACGHLVVWARDRIRSHKKSNCPNATESEKKMFANKSTNKKVKPKNEVRPFKIAECLKDFDKITSRGKCKDCGKKVQWSRAASIAHKVTCEKSTEELEKICGLKKNREVKTTPKRPDKTSIVMPSAILDAPDDSSEAHPDFYDIVSPKKKIEDQPMTQQSRANNDCFICKTSFEGSRKRLTNNLDFSETPVFEVLGELRSEFPRCLLDRCLVSILESFTGADITKDELKTSGICINCFSELNKFDEFQHLSKMIQLKITDAFQRTRSEQIFVKSEMIFEDEEHVDDHPTIDQEAEPDFLAEDSEKILDETRQSDLEDDEINFSPIADVTLECDKCSKRCKSQNQMEFHMVAEHSLDNQNGPFECHKCAKTLMTKTGLLKHGSIHEPDRNFLCTE